MTRQKIDGYVFRQQIVRVRQAVASIRESLRRLNDENPGPQTRSMLIAKGAMALSEIQEAVVDLERIVAPSPSPALPQMPKSTEFGEGGRG